MQLNDWLRKHKDNDTRARVCGDVGCAVLWLHQVAGGHKTASAARCKALEDATRSHTPDDVVTRAEVRPDLFG